jgi:hypothetical protein
MNLAEQSVRAVGILLTRLSYEQGNNWDDEDPDDVYYISHEAIGELDTSKDVDTSLGTLKEIDSYGGEGRGEEYWKVFSLTQGEIVRTFKLDGYYSSYTEGGYDEFYEVTPELKTITVWKKV